jgi:uncharacterized protein
MIVDISFEYIVALIILVSMLTQLLFGVGVLLWGTPSLILLGYEFTTALSLLLPISLGISGLQVGQNFQHINKKETWSFIKLSLPLVVVGLIFVMTLDLNVEWFVFGALGIGGLLRLNRFKTLSDRVLNFKDFMLPLIGVVHGMSNLGGGLLVIWVSQTDKTKLGLRSTVAACYLLLALFQIVTLMVYNDESIIFVSYFVFGILAYVILDKFIIASIKDNIFDVLLTCAIFSMAFLMGLKAASVI